jgi:hypothetical protein
LQIKLSYDATKEVLQEDGSTRHSHLAPANYTGKLIRNRRMAAKKRKVDANTGPDVGVELANDEWWSQGNKFAPNSDHANRHKKRRMDVGLYQGARVEVYWGEEEAGPGKAGYFGGEVVGFVDEGEEMAQYGDHLILYDDDAARGETEPIVECLLSGQDREALWRFEEK